MLDRGLWRLLLNIHRPLRLGSPRRPSFCLLNMSSSPPPPPPCYPLSASPSTAMNPPGPDHLLPIVAVIGTTGVGKSKLSIELAKHIQAVYQRTLLERESGSSSTPLPQHPVQSQSWPSSSPRSIQGESTSHLASSSTHDLLPRSASSFASHQTPTNTPAASSPSFPSPVSPAGPQWRFAEVINADSMQIYQGLDIITNKVTEEEMEGVPHRLLGVVDPRSGERGWGMAKWVARALEEVGKTAVFFF